MAFYGILEPCPGNINSANRSLLQGTQQPYHCHALAPHNATASSEMGQAETTRSHKVQSSIIIISSTQDSL